MVCLRELVDEFLSKYGVVVPSSPVEESYLMLGGAVEKPGIEEAPSRLGMVGRYLFTPEVFALLDKTAPGTGGEIQLTDAIDGLGKAGRLRGLRRGARPPRRRHPARAPRGLGGPGKGPIRRGVHDLAGGSARDVKTLEEARSEVLRSVETLDIEPVSIWDASGRVLAADVTAAESVPPFRNSAMDGYAVLGADVARPGAVLDVIGDLAAGFVA